jgi:hypothetical protein
MKYWEVIADKLHASGWSWGYCSAVTKDGCRYIVHSDELLSAPKAKKSDRLRPSLQLHSFKPGICP